MLSRELHATFPELHPIRCIAPVKEHCTRPERVQCSLIGCTTRSQQATARIHVRGSAAPPTGPTLRTTPKARGQLQHFSPKRGEHQTTMPLVLSGVTPLSGVLHRLGDGVMLPNWCRAARRGSAGIMLEQLSSRSCRAWACCSVALHHLAQHCTGKYAVHCRAI